MDLARVTSSVRMDDTVRVKDPRRRRWSEQAGVVDLSVPRSCDVQCEDGRHGACEGSKTTKMVGARRSSRPQRTSLV